MIKNNIFFEKDIVRKVLGPDGECTIVIKKAKFRKSNGEEILLDEDILNNMINKIGSEILRTKTRYIDTPKLLVISPDNNIKELQEGRSNETDRSLSLASIIPKYSLDEVYVSQKVKEQVTYTLSLIKNRKDLFEKWGIGEGAEIGRSAILNFYGPPGTGKSMMAEAIAHSLDKKFYQVNYADLESKYVGETPKNIKYIFEKAMQEDAVIVFDEADSFMSKRLTNITQSADYGVNLARSLMLMELEKFSGIVIFTTNLFKNYDPAFKRRILANVEFDMPDEHLRKYIWEQNLGHKLPLSYEVNADKLARKYSSISGADIKDITLYAAAAAFQDRCKFLTLDYFDKAYEMVKNRYAIEGIQSITHETVTKEEMEKTLKEK